MRPLKKDATGWGRCGVAGAAAGGRLARVATIYRVYKAIRVRDLESRVRNVTTRPSEEERPRRVSRCVVMFSSTFCCMYNVRGWPTIRLDGRWWMLIHDLLGLILKPLVDADLVRPGEFPSAVVATTRFSLTRGCRIDWGSCPPFNSEDVECTILFRWTIAVTSRWVRAGDMVYNFLPSLGSMKVRL
jgi:hypothetical protein